MDQNGLPLLAMQSIRYRACVGFGCFVASIQPVGAVAVRMAKTSHFGRWVATYQESRLTDCWLDNPHRASCRCVAGRCCSVHPVATTSPEPRPRLSQAARFGLVTSRPGPDQAAEPWHISSQPKPSGYPVHLPAMSKAASKAESSHCPGVIGANRSVGHRSSIGVWHWLLSQRSLYRAS